MPKFGANAGASHSNKLAMIMILLASIVVSHKATATPSYSIHQMISIAAEQNPLINVYKAREDAASASVVTARTFANPEFELQGGPTRYRTPGGQGANGSWVMGITQPLDYPSVRNAKIDVAENNIAVASLSTEVTKRDLITRVKSAFYDVLQREAFLGLAEADYKLLKDIRDRVKLRVEVGESPKYELIKANTEALAAERDFQSAKTRVLEGKSYLRGLVGAAIPEDFTLVGELPVSNSLPKIDTLREQMNDSPQLKQIRAAIKTSEANLRLQDELRNPGLSLKAGVEQDPDLRQFRIGVAIPIPVWDKRSGPIAYAAAELKEAQAVLSERELTIQRDVESAYQRYLIAQQQLSAFEDGLLEQAESVLKVAEAAYRFGERGILDYLDAQRTKRAVRKDYLSARYEYINAMLTIERLLGYELLEVKPQ